LYDSRRGETEKRYTERGESGGEENYDGRKRLGRKEMWRKEDSGMIDIKALELCNQWEVLLIRELQTLDNDPQSTRYRRFDYTLEER
jgi:hypothetical protein